MKNTYRKPRLADLAYLVDIDLKCYEDAWDAEKWRIVLMDFTLQAVVGLRGQTVGCGVWKLETGVAKVLRLGVKPAYRNYGIGSELLRAIENNKKISTVVFKIPESLCCPSAPSDVSQWLNNRGYKAGRVCSSGAIFCGQVEDAFMFSKTLGD